MGRDGGRDSSVLLELRARPGFVIRPTWYGEAQNSITVNVDLFGKSRTPLSSQVKLCLVLEQSITLGPPRLRLSSEEFRFYEKNPLVSKRNV